MQKRRFSSKQLSEKACRAAASRSTFMWMTQGARVHPRFLAFKVSVGVSAVAYPLE